MALRLGNSNLDNIIEELLWFLSGGTNVKDLIDRGCNIWNPDAFRWYQEQWPETGIDSQKKFTELLKNAESSKPQAGYLGPIYGAQWRSWPTAEYETVEEWPVRKTIDQIAEVVKSIKEDPFSRRHVVNAWNVADIPKMALPPCHVMFQFYVSNDRKLSCQLYQRSGDVFLGVPYNIASYALLTMMIADQCGLGYGEFIHSFGDAHIYLNHIDQVVLQLSREPKPLPKMTIIGKPKDIFSYKREDFFLSGYDPHGPLKGAVSVGL